MNQTLAIRSHQRRIPVNARHLRRLTRALLRDLLQLEDFDLAIQIVTGARMAKLNESFLHHLGSTDVLAFDYASTAGGSGRRARPAETKVRQQQEICPALHGELFICIDEAISQAQRFRTTWQSELVRYVIHGILHLRGYDDKAPAARRLMKCEENRLLKAAQRRFRLSKLGRASRLAA